MEKAEKAEKAVSVKSVKKALDALDCVVAGSIGGDGVALGEIASRLGIRNTTAHNILKTMEVCGYISRAGGRLYAPGAKCVQFQRSPRTLNRMIEASKGIVAGLAEKTGESFVLATLLNGERRVLLRAKGGGTISVETQHLDSSGAYSLVTTRAMLACASGAELAFFLQKNGMPGMEWKGVSDMKSLEGALAKIRKSGLAEDKTPELAALAVPILGGDGFLLGALGAYVPLFRFGRKKKDELVRVLKKAARQIAAATEPQ